MKAFKRVQSVNMYRAHNAHVGPAGLVVGRSSQAEEHMSLESWR